MRIGQTWVDDVFEWEVKITDLKYDNFGNDLVYLVKAENTQIKYSESPMIREEFLRDFTLKGENNV